MRSISAAISYARNSAEAGRNIGEGMCLRNVRTAYGIPAAGDVDKDGDADAVDGLLTTARLYKPEVAHTRRGGFVWWRNRNRPGHGHVAIPTGDGECWSPGSPDYPARWHKLPIDELSRRWGLEPAGWSPDFNGVTVWTPPPPPPPARPNVEHAVDDLERAARANARRPRVLARVRAALAALKPLDRR